MGRAQSTIEYFMQLFKHQTIYYKTITNQQMSQMNEPLISGDCI